jgi:NADPH:quinone reductase-like Zn-dependent oxidoreductase
MGMRVTAVCHANHVAAVQALGADVVIDYTKQDFTALHESFHFVFDSVGKSTFGKCKRILTRKGIYISTEFGPWIQNPFLAILTPLFGGKKLMFPIPTISQQDVAYLRDLVATGKFKPLIDRHYPLDNIADAYRYVLTGQKTGNVIIDVIEKEVMVN